jgi:hypothetical protein
MPADLPPLPMSKILEERYCKELMSQALDSFAIGAVYVNLVPNVKFEPNTSRVSKRMNKLKKLGLIGCFNDTGITSTNYKEFIYGQEETNS